MEIYKNQSWYVNPNIRQVTSNIKNTAIKDSEAKAAYEMLKANNRTYTFADEKTFYKTLLNNLT